MKIEPTISKNRDGYWVCHDNFYIWGKGGTPDEAYLDWCRKELRRTRIPRKGLWNLKDCMSWYNRGCPMIRIYIGNKQFVGYDKSTDELILRG